MKPYSTVLRLISVVTLAAFLTTQTSPPSYAAPVKPGNIPNVGAGFPRPLTKGADTALLHDIQIPNALGEIREIFNAPSSPSQTIVLIQDAHAVPEAQDSIRKLIDHFQSEYGILNVALEGASKPLDPQIFRSFPDRERLKKVFQEYMDRGELTGPTAAAVLGSDPNGVRPHQTRFHGVEDWDLYEQGVRLYLAALGKEAGILEKLEREKAECRKRKAEAYSKELLELDEALERFYENEMNVVAILRKLAEVKEPVQGSELSLILAEIRKEGRENAPFEIEVKRLAAKVSKTLKTERSFNEKLQEFRTSQISAEAFALFLKETIQKRRLPIKISNRLLETARHQKKIRDIQGTELFEEFEEYAEGVMEALLGSDPNTSGVRPQEEAKALHLRTKHLRLLTRLAKLELSQKDWEEVKKSHVGAPLMAPSDVKGVINKAGVMNHAPTIDVDLSVHIAFYRNTEARESAMFRNLLRNTHDVIRNTLLVAGGFHTEGLTHHLKQAGISYVLVMPKIQSMPERSLYREHMQGRVSWAPYFQVKNGRVNVYEAFVRATRNRLLERAKGGKGEREKLTPIRPFAGLPILKQWRDQIIRDAVEQEKISSVREYTRFLDELTHDAISATQHGGPAVNFGGRNTYDGIVASAVRFADGLRKLHSERRLTEANILQLLKPANIIEGVKSTAGVPGDTISAEFLTEIHERAGLKSPPVRGLTGARMARKDQEVRINDGGVLPGSGQLNKIRLLPQRPQSLSLEKSPAGPSYSFSPLGLAAKGGQISHAPTSINNRIIETARRIFKPVFQKKSLTSEALEARQPLLRHTASDGSVLRRRSSAVETDRAQHGRSEARQFFDSTELARTLLDKHHLVTLFGIGIGAVIGNLYSNISSKLQDKWVILLTGALIGGLLGFGGERLLSRRFSPQKTAPAPEAQFEDFDTSPSRRTIRDSNPNRSEARSWKGDASEKLKQEVRLIFGGALFHRFGRSDLITGVDVRVLESGNLDIDFQLNSGLSGTEYYNEAWDILNHVKGRIVHEVRLSKAPDKRTLPGQLLAKLIKKKKAILETVTAEIDAKVERKAKKAFQAIAKANQRRVYPIPPLHDRPVVSPEQRRLQENSLWGAATHIIEGWKRSEARVDLKHNSIFAPQAGYTRKQVVTVLGVFLGVVFVGTFLSPIGLFDPSPGETSRIEGLSVVSRDKTWSAEDQASRKNIASRLEAFRGEMGPGTWLVIYYLESFGGMNFEYFLAPKTSPAPEAAQEYGKIIQDLRALQGRHTPHSDWTMLVSPEQVWVLDGLSSTSHRQLIRPQGGRAVMIFPNFGQSVPDWMDISADRKPVPTARMEKAAVFKSPIGGDPAMAIDQGLQRFYDRQAASTQLPRSEIRASRVKNLVWSALAGLALFGLTGCASVENWFEEWKTSPAPRERLPLEFQPADSTPPGVLTNVPSVISSASNDIDFKFPSGKSFGMPGSWDSKPSRSEAGRDGGWPFRQLGTRPLARAEARGLTREQFDAHMAKVNEAFRFGKPDDLDSLANGYYVRGMTEQHLEWVPRLNIKMRSRADGEDGNHILGALLTDEQIKDWLHQFDFMQDVAGDPDQAEEYARIARETVEITHSPLHGGVGESVQRIKLLEIQLLEASLADILDKGLKNLADVDGKYRPGIKKYKINLKLGRTDRIISALREIEKLSGRPKVVVKQGAKGTDLGVHLRSNGKKIFIPTAEGHFNQMIYMARNHEFAGMRFRGLVNFQSKQSFLNLLEKDYFLDVLNEAPVLRKYKDVLRDHRIEFLEMYDQKDVPKIEIDHAEFLKDRRSAQGLPTLDANDPKKRQPGGHGQIGVYFVLLFSQKKSPEDGRTHIEMFGNGDNPNKRVNKYLAGFVAKHHLPILGLNTPATLIDKKGGKWGVMPMEVDGGVVYVPVMVEEVDAKNSGQAQMFYEAGQPGGIGRKGKQPFNTNLFYFERDLLYEILHEMRTIVNNNEEFFSRVSPILFNKYEKAQQIGDKWYVSIDGAIAHVIQNLNMFYMLDPRFKELRKKISDKYGIDRLLYFVNMPRWAFAPEKAGSDWWLRNGTDFYKLNEETFVFEETDPSSTPPGLDFTDPVKKYNPVKRVWEKTDSKYWLETRRFWDFTSKAKVTKLIQLKVQGRVILTEGPVELEGEPEIINLWGTDKKKSGRANTVNFRLSRFRKQLVEHQLLSSDGTLHLKNVRITIDTTGRLKAEPLSRSEARRPEQLEGRATVLRRAPKGEASTAQSSLGAMSELRTAALKENIRKSAVFAGLHDQTGLPVDVQVEFIQHLLSLNLRPEVENMEVIERLAALSLAEKIAFPVPDEYSANKALVLQAVRAGVPVMIASVLLDAEFIREVKRENPSVFIVSGAANETQADQAVSNGADGVKIKPFGKPESNIEPNVQMVLRLKERHPERLFGGAAGIKVDKLARVFATDAAKEKMDFVGIGIDAQTIEALKTEAEGISQERDRLLSSSSRSEARMKDMRTRETEFDRLVEEPLIWDLNLNSSDETRTLQIEAQEWMPKIETRPRPLVMTLKKGDETIRHYILAVGSVDNDEQGDTIITELYIIPWEENTDLSQYSEPAFLIPTIVSSLDESHNERPFRFDFDRVPTLSGKETGIQQLQISLAPASSRSFDKVEFRLVPHEKFDHVLTDGTLYQFASDWNRSEARSESRDSDTPPQNRGLGLRDSRSASSGVRDVYVRANLRVRSQVNGQTRGSAPTKIRSTNRLAAKAAVHYAEYHREKSLATAREISASVLEVEDRELDAFLEAFVPAVANEAANAYREQFKARAKQLIQAVRTNFKVSGVTLAVRPDSTVDPRLYGKAAGVLNGLLGNILVAGHLDESLQESFQERDIHASPESNINRPRTFAVKQILAMLVGDKQNDVENHILQVGLDSSGYTASDAEAYYDKLYALMFQYASAYAAAVSLNEAEAEFLDYVEKLGGKEMLSLKSQRDYFDEISRKLLEQIRKFDDGFGLIDLKTGLPRVSLSQVHAFIAAQQYQVRRRVSSAA